MPDGRSMTLWVTIGIAAVPVVAFYGAMSYAVSETRTQMREMETRLTAEIQKVDINSANRRNESHLELVRLHDIQARQIEDNRDDIRELRER